MYSAKVGVVEANPRIAGTRVPCATGMYTIEQLDPGCAAWSVRLDWMTN